MRRGGGLQIRGVPVELDPAFFAVAALVGIGGGRGPGRLILFVIVVLISVLWHEMGHAVMFRHFGRAPRISLHGMGGLTSADGADVPFTPGQRFLSSLAGPVTGLVLGGLVLVLGRLFDFDLMPPLVA